MEEDRGSYLLLIGVSFLFIPCVDLIHTLAYKGMGVFATTSNTPTSLWIFARYLQAGTFIAAAIGHKRNWAIRPMIAAFATVTVVGLASILVWDIFPVTYIEGVGLTPFKVVSEYIISAMFLVSLYLLHRIRGDFEPKIYGLLSLAIVFSVLSELSFSSYVGVYDFANLLGHIFKLVVTYLMFKALVKEGIESPFNVIFHDYQVTQSKLLSQAEELRDKTEKLDATNEELTASNEELQATDEELRKYVSNLEEMVEERTRELREGEEKLRQSYAFAAVGRMGATIAHDLRAPLNIISIAAEGLDKFPERREHLIEMIRTNASRANEMIEDMRNSTRDIEIRPLEANLTALIATAVDESTAPPLVEKRVEAGEGLESVMIDPNLLRRVLDNLIKNGVEAMPNGGKLTVSTQRKGNLIEICVADTGTGISGEVATRLFEPFYTTKSNGTGLGLPFCKRALEAHGGELTFESELGVGTTFKATLKEKNPKENEDQGWLRLDVVRSFYCRVGR